MRVPQYVAVIVIAGVSIALGVVVGYTFREKHDAENYLLALAAGDAIRDARTSYTILRLLEKDGNREGKRICSNPLTYRPVFDRKLDVPTR